MIHSEAVSHPDVCVLPVVPLRTARCACQDCGAHTTKTVGFVIGGTCPNCGSYDLVRVAVVESRIAGRW